MNQIIRHRVKKTKQVKEFELFLVYATSWTQGAEGTIGESENIKMAKIVFERDACYAAVWINSNVQEVRLEQAFDTIALYV